MRPVLHNLVCGSIVFAGVAAAAALIGWGSWVAYAILLSAAYGLSAGAHAMLVVMVQETPETWAEWALAITCCVLWPLFDLWVAGKFFIPERRSS